MIHLHSQGNPFFLYLLSINLILELEESYNIIKSYSPKIPFRSFENS